MSLLRPRFKCPRCGEEYGFLSGFYAANFAPEYCCDYDKRKIKRKRTGLSSADKAFLAGLATLAALRLYKGHGS